MKYTSIANTISSIMERVNSLPLTPIVNTDGEEETPAEEPEAEDDPDTSIADTTVNYPPKDHDRLETTHESDRERMKSHLKHSMRRQHKMKTIDT